LLAAQIRRGEAVDLWVGIGPERGHRARRNIRLDELVPLCRSIEFEDPSLRDVSRLHRAPGSQPGRCERVTAVIPCSRDLPIGLTALLEQDVGVDVLILSNGDGPTDVEGARVVRVEWEGHGTTRARALEHVETDYVFFTVDDAIPLGAGCLRTLMEALDQGSWDAAVARQLPWPDADAVTAARLRRWTPPGHQVVPMSQTDHVATLYKTDTLRRHPIPGHPIAEDAWWSLNRRVAYVPMAPVLHSHQRLAVELFQRNRDIHQQLVTMGRPPAVPTLVAAIAALPGVVRPTLSAGPSELINQLAELAGQWQGAVRAR
jgi:hypothetical protein